MEDKNLELLKFSYSKLHESLWESHKVAWTITSIFIPVIFALQGYLAKEYVFSTKQPIWEILPAKPSILAPVFGVFMIELLLLFWRAMLWMLEHYNRHRVRKLRHIEDAFAEEFRQEGGSVDQSQLVRQFGGFSYKRKIFRKTKISWNSIYNLIVVLITIINIVFITSRVCCRYGTQPAIFTALSLGLVLVFIGGWLWIQSKRKQDKSKDASE